LGRPFLRVSRQGTASAVPKKAGEILLPLARLTRAKYFLLPSIEPKKPELPAPLVQT